MNSKSSWFPKRNSCPAIWAKHVFGSKKKAHVTTCACRSRCCAVWCSFECSWLQTAAGWDGPSYAACNLSLGLCLVKLNSRFPGLSRWQRPKQPPRFDLDMPRLPRWICLKYVEVIQTITKTRSCFEEVGPHCVWNVTDSIYLYSLLPCTSSSIIHTPSVLRTSFG